MGKAKSSTEDSRLWKRLMAAWDAGDAACHFENAERYTKAYPANWWGWVALADVLVRMARYDEGSKALQRAEMEVEPKFLPFIYVQWGRFYNEACDLKSAEIWYRRAVKLKNKTTNRIFLGAILSKQGRFAEAKMQFKRAIRLGGDLVDEAYLNLGLVLRAEGQYKAALECFDRALRIDPKYREAKEARRDVLKAIKAIKLSSGN